MCACRGERAGISRLNRRKRKGYATWGTHKKLRHPRRMVKKCRRRRKIFVWTSREISSFTFCVRPASPSYAIYPHVCVLSAARKDPLASFSALKPFFLSFSRKTRDATAEISSFLYRQERISLLHEGLWELPLCTPIRARAGSSRVCIASCASPAAPLFTFRAATRHPLLFFGSLTLFPLVFYSTCEVNRSSETMFLNQ